MAYNILEMPIVKANIVFNAKNYRESFWNFTRDVVKFFLYV